MSIKDLCRELVSWAHKEGIKKVDLEAELQQAWADMTPLKHVPWTREEEEYLRYYGRGALSIREIAKNLGRTRGSVASHRSRWGLQDGEPLAHHPDSKFDSLPAFEAAAQLGTTTESVNLWRSLPKNAPKDVPKGLREGDVVTPRKGDVVTLRGGKVEYLLLDVQDGCADIIQVQKGTRQHTPMARSFSRPLHSLRPVR